MKHRRRKVNNQWKRKEYSRKTKRIAGILAIILCLYLFGPRTTTPDVEGKLVSIRLGPAGTGKTIELFDSRVEENPSQEQNSLNSLVCSGPVTLGPPLAGSFPITSGHGPRDLGDGYHTGVDFGTPIGTPTIAMAPGSIVDILIAGKNDHGFGNTVVLKPDGLSFMIVYSHLNEIYVKIGDKVGANHPLGTTGSTGFSTGPHLHLGIHGPKNFADTPDGKYISSTLGYAINYDDNSSRFWGPAIDPEPFLSYTFDPAKMSGCK